MNKNAKVKDWCERELARLQAKNGVYNPPFTHTPDAEEQRHRDNGKQQGLEQVLMLWKQLSS